MSDPQHLAEQSAATRIAEHKGWAVSRLTGIIPDRNGKHRVVESFNPATGIYATIKGGAES